MVRVTQSMLTNNMLRNLRQSYNKMSEYQDQLSTGKKITRPSQDPIVAMQGMSYRTNLMEVQQFQRNLTEATNWIEGSDSALSHANQILHRGRELVVQLSNGTYNDSEKAVIVSEIEQLKQDLIATANTRNNGKYIFNGENTLNPPVEDANGVTQVKTAATPGDVRIEVSKGIEIQVNIDPNNVFGQELFDMFDNLKASLTGGASEKEIQGYLGDFDTHMDNLLSERAELGARSNRFELVESRLGQLEVITSKMLSENEDADMERVITNLKTQESVHQAALSVGARIIQPTLMDFLR